MLPVLGAVALGAGLKGLTNWIGGQAQEKADKKEAMRQLYNRYLSGGNMMQFGQQPKKGPGIAESIGMPLLNAGIKQASLSKEEQEAQKDEDWYQQAAKGYLSA